MEFKGLQPILYGGREVWPLIEGGKGVSATNHMSSGAWAAAGGIGTVSAVNADSYDAEGRIIPQIYDALTRLERHEQLVRYAIDGAVEQVKRAYEIASGKGAININVLWEMGGAQEVLEGVLEKTKGLVAGVTCGAGMPYRLSEIAQRYNVNYLPIISSARAFRALWKRAYHKVSELMAAVVYEDPWLAGGHNGLVNAEDPLNPEDPFPRVKALRDTMRTEGLSDQVPIIMAGGVLVLREWEHWIDNPELGHIAFQYGTRPLLTGLSHCGFSSWKDHDDFTTGRLADPRSFCIQKTLQDIAHGKPIDENLMFAGHAAYRFKQDPFYSNNFTPTVKQLVDRILAGDLSLPIIGNFRPAHLAVSPAALRAGLVRSVEFPAAFAVAGDVEALAFVVLGHPHRQQPRDRERGDGGRHRRPQCHRRDRRAPARRASSPLPCPPHSRRRRARAP